MNTKATWINRVLLASAAAAVIGLTVLLVSQPAPVKEQSFRMANGDVVTLAAVTYGTNGLVWGKPYQKTLYRLLPARFKGFSGCMTMSSNPGMASSSQPVFWVHESQHQFGADNFAVRVLDEYGWAHDPNGYAMGSTYLPKGGTMLYYQLNTALPRGEVVGICLYASPARTNRLGTFLLPDMKEPSRWKSTAQPQSPQQIGDVSFQLNELRTGMKSATNSPGMRVTDGGSFSQAIFRVTRDGKPISSWLPLSIVLTKPDGGNFRIRSRELGYRDDEIAVGFDGKLEPAAGLWKLRVEFVQQRDFAAEELVEFRNIPFPGAGEVMEVNSSTNLQGATVALLKAYGSSSERPANTPSWFAGRVFLEARMTPVTNTVHFRALSAADDRGNEVTYSSTTGAAGTIYVVFQQTTIAKTIDLKFAVHHSRFVEFEAGASERAP